MAIINTVVNKDINTTSTIINTDTTLNNNDLSGIIIGSQYQILSKMNTKSGEADLYRCSDGINEYVAKIYNRKIAIKEEVIDVLKHIDSPYVARIYNTGVYQGYTYEILPYFSNPLSVIIEQLKLMSFFGSNGFPPP